MGVVRGGLAPAYSIIQLEPIALFIDENRKREFLFNGSYVKML